MLDSGVSCQAVRWTNPPEPIRSTEMAERPWQKLHMDFYGPHSTAKIDNRLWQQELSRFLLQYRTTPHCSTGVSPAELLFNRTVQGKLPILWKSNVLDKHQQARDNERKRKEYNEGYANRKQRTKKSDVQVGDCVLVNKNVIINLRRIITNALRCDKKRTFARNSKKQRWTHDHQKCVPLQESKSCRKMRKRTGQIGENLMRHKDNQPTSTITCNTSMIRVPFEDQQERRSDRKDMGSQFYRDYKS